MQYRRPGILLLSHGIPSGADHPGNLRMIEHTEDMAFPWPTIHGFVQVAGHLQTAVDALTDQGVDLIVGVFLYPPSVNREITNPRAELGFADPPQNWKFPFNPVTTTARVILGKTMQAHPLIADILEDRLRAVSTDAANEAALIIIHGDAGYPAHQLHEEYANALVRILRTRGSFKAIGWSTLYPEPTTAEVAAGLLTQADAIVAANLMLDDTYFNREKLPAGLAGIDRATYNPEPLMPHPAMRRYILHRVGEALRDHGFADLVPAEAEACAHPLCKLNADTRVPADEKPLVCCTGPCGFPGQPISG